MTHSECFAADLFVLQEYFKAQAARCEAEARMVAVDGLSQQALHDDLLSRHLAYEDAFRKTSIIYEKCETRLTSGNAKTGDKK